MSIAALFLLFAIADTDKVFAMSDSQVGQLWNCHVPGKQLKLLSEPSYHQHRGRVVLMYRLSTLGDDTQDAILIFETRSQKPQVFPHYYIYDLDRDGLPDKAYVDEFGNGLCQQMREVQPSEILKDMGKPA